MLKEIKLFYTPRSMNELHDMIDKLPVSERAIVYPYVMMMYNMLVVHYAEEKKSEHECKVPVTRTGLGPVSSNTGYNVDESIIL